MKLCFCFTMIFIFLILETLFPVASTNLFLNPKSLPGPRLNRLDKKYVVKSNGNMAVVKPDKAIKEIDGSVLEGGGQILRLSVAFSCLLEQPIRITKIRSGRSSPGLRPQHLSGIELVRQMCNATTNGNRLNSCELTFQPKTLKQGKCILNIDTKTAASIPLMIQSVLPVAIFGDHSYTITMVGGTDVSFAPSMDYVQNVLFPIYKLFGIHCDVNIMKRGYYPKGRGTVQLTVKPIIGYLNPIQINQFGDRPAIRAIVFISGPENTHQISIDIAEAVKDKLNASGYHKVSIERNVEVLNSSGGSLVLIADTGKCLIGSSALYDSRKSTPKSITDEACEKLFLDLEAKSCVDANTMDNLIIFMALAKGQSQVSCREITLHTKTAIHIAEQFTNAKFTIKQMEDGLHEIVCNGIGLKL